MNFIHLAPRSGFIALTSMLILFAFMMVLATGIALTSFIARGVASASYYKEVSHAFAESCVQSALLKLAANPAYAGNETLTVATSTLETDTCAIGPVIASSTELIIQASSTFQNSGTMIRATVNASDLTIAGWEEL